MKGPHLLGFISVLATTTALFILPVWATTTETKRPLLIKIDGTYCRKCKEMNSKILSNPEFKKFAQDQFDILKLNTERLADKTDLPKLNQRITDPLTQKAIAEHYSELDPPYYIVIDSDGKTIQGIIQPSTDLEKFKTEISAAIKLPKAEIPPYFQDVLNIADPILSLEALSKDAKKIPSSCRSKNDEQNKALIKAFQTGLEKGATGQEWIDSMKVRSWNHPGDVFSPKNPNRYACRDYLPSSRLGKKLRQCCIEGFKAVLPDIRAAIEKQEDSQTSAIIRCRREYKLGKELTRPSCHSCGKLYTINNEITHLACFHMGFKDGYESCMKESRANDAISDNENKISEDFQNSFLCTPGSEAGVQQ